MDNAKKLLPNHQNIVFCKNPLDAVTNADAVVLVTEWKEIIDIDPKKIHPLLKEKVFFDGRNQYNPKYMKELGFEYYSIGR